MNFHFDGFMDLYEKLRIVSIQGFCTFMKRSMWITLNFHCSYCWTDLTRMSVILYIPAGTGVTHTSAGVEVNVRLQSCSK